MAMAMNIDMEEIGSKEELTSLTCSDITKGLYNLEHEKREELCKNLKEAYRLVDCELGVLNSKQDLYSFSKIRDALQPSEDYVDFLNAPICQIGEKTLTLDRFLIFCEVLVRGNWGRKEFNTIRKNLEINSNCNKKIMFEIVSLFDKILKNSLDIDTLGIECFQDAYKMLRSYQEPFSIEKSKGDQKLSIREIAESLLTLNSKEVNVFCERILSLKNCIKWELYSYNLKTVRRILDILDTGDKDHDHIKNFQLVKLGDHFLTLKAYLEYCLTLTVFSGEEGKEGQNWIPFIQKGRYSDREQFLKVLGFSETLQYSDKLFQELKAIQGYFTEPFHVTPSDLIFFKLEYKKLEDKYAAKMNMKSDGEYVEEWILNHKKSVTIGVLSVVAAGIRL